MIRKEIYLPEFQKRYHTAPETTSLKMAVLAGTTVLVKNIKLRYCEGNQFAVIQTEGSSEISFINTPIQYSEIFVSESTESNA